MPYLGNSHIAGDQINNFKVLDDISSHTSTFDGSASGVVSISDNTIRIPEHRFVQGQRVTYNNGGGGNIGNLSSGTAYYIIKDTNNTIKLATSLSNANNSTAINLSVLGSGSSHTLNVAFDGVNTKFKITHNGGTSGRINNATQLSLAINNVIQRPNQNAITFTEGFAIEDQHKIVFKVAPVSSDIFWGSILANTLPTFDITDNKIDNFTGDGSTTEFNLSNIPASNKSIMVTINGVLQHPSDGSTSRSYTLLANILQFTAAPGNGDEIQVRHIGFAGASTSDVTGFYGRTGNVVLTSNDHITTGNINAGVVTATTFVGNLTGNVSGNLTVGGVLTYEDVTNVDSIGIITARSGFKVLAGGANVVGVITARTNIHLEDYIHHLGDLTTKIGFPSANTFTVDTAGDERLRINSTGQLLHGHNASIGYGRNFETSSTSGYGGIAINRFSADTGSGGLDFVKSRNASLGGNTIVQSDDNLGAITWRGADGTDFTTPAAQIKVAVDGTPGENDMPGRIMFYTTADGASSVSERLRIQADGDVSFGDETTGRAQIKHLSGNQSDRNNGGFPQYAFVGNEGTGMRRVSSNVLAFDTNGAQRVLITSTGDVAINRSAPLNTSKFSLTKDPDQQGIGVQLNQSSGITTSLAAYNSSGSNIFDLAHDTDSTPDLLFKLKHSSDALPVEKFRMTSSGRFGIGSDNPDAQLHLDSSDSRIRWTKSNGAADNKHWDLGSTTANLLRLQAKNDANAGGGNLFDFYRSGNQINEFRGMKSGAYWFVVDNLNQRVGINSSDPSSPLEIYTAASSAWKFRIRTSVSDGAGFYQRSNGDFEMVLRDASNNNNYIAGTGGDLQFVTSATEKFRITSDGKVKIGNSGGTPDGKLQIDEIGNGDIVAELTSGSPMFTYRNGTNSWFHAGKHPTDDAFVVTTGGTTTTSEKLRITAGGQIKLNISSNGALTEPLVIRNGGTGAGTNVGMIFYNGDESSSGAGALAKIKAIDEGSYDGALVFETASKNGWSNTGTSESLRISSEGYITTPSNVLFSANSGPADLTDAVIIFGNSIFQRGGTNYDTSTGIFTAPVDGIYHFMCNPYRYTTSADSYITLQTSTNNGSSWNNQIEIRGFTNGANGWLSLSLSHLIDLNSGNQVRIYATNRIHCNGVFSRFSGMLVG